MVAKCLAMDIPYNYIFIQRIVVVGMNTQGSLNVMLFGIFLGLLALLLTFILLFVIVKYVYQILLYLAYCYTNGPTVEL